MLLEIIDIGTAVKKIAVMLQKYVEPESTWNFLPFADDTATAAESSASVPNNIWMTSKAFMLNSYR